MVGLFAPGPAKAHLTSNRTEIAQLFLWRKQWPTDVVLFGPTPSVSGPQFGCQRFPKGPSIRRNCCWNSCHSSSVRTRCDWAIVKSLLVLSSMLLLNKLTINLYSGRFGSPCGSTKCRSSCISWSLTRRADRMLNFNINFSSKLFWIVKEKCMITHWYRYDAKHYSGSLWWRWWNCWRPIRNILKIVIR